MNVYAIASNSALLSGGKHAARKLKRAQILLGADVETRDADIARSVAAAAASRKQ
jgi:hypothetical protein